jgi:hypothetical protein
MILGDARPGTARVDSSVGVIRGQERRDDLDGGFDDIGVNERDVCDQSDGVVPEFGIIGVDQVDGFVNGRSSTPSTSQKAASARRLPARRRWPCRAPRPLLGDCGRRTRGRLSGATRRRYSRREQVPDGQTRTGRCSSRLVPATASRWQYRLYRHPSIRIRSLARRVSERGAGAAGR